VTCDESDLAAGVAAGTASAFEVIFERYARSVFRVCARRLERREDAEDAMAATFLHAWQLRGRVVVVDGSVRPWLLGIAVNVARNAARADRRRTAAWQRQTVIWQGLVTGPEDVVVESMTAVRDAAVVADEIERLPGREKAVVELCLLEGLSITAAAVVLAIPEGTVRSRLYRARRRLRALLQNGESAGESGCAGEREAVSGHHLRGRHPAVHAIDNPTGQLR